MGAQDRQAGSRLRVRFGEPIRYNSSPDHYVKGDVWASAWAADGTLYTVSDDFFGWQGSFGDEGRNVSVCRLDGQPPEFQGALVNGLDELGRATDLGEDGACWKASGLGAIDGALYLFIARHWYGHLVPGRRQIVQNAYLLRSDDGGASWVWGEQGSSPERPLFPGPGFASPYFVDYGQDGSTPEIHRAGEFVYAVSNDGVWNNGDCMTLGRARRERLRDASTGDWEFYLGGDGSDDASWGSLGESTPIVTAMRRCGMTGLHYLPTLDRYLMMQWSYPDLTPEKLSVDRSIWELYEARTPWGPYRRVSTFEWDQGFYNPYLPSKFLARDGRSGSVLCTGNFHTSREPWDSTLYSLYTVPIELDLG